MASNVSTVDGMGFEEVNQPTYTEMISGNNIYGVNLWVSARGEINQISGATGSFGAMNITTDLNVGDALDCRTLQVDNNRIYSTSIQNATELFGYKVKAGSVAMGNDISGLIAFVSAGSFSTANYFIVAGAAEYGAPQWSRTGSQSSYGVSGLKRASGCWIVGGSDTVVDWIAVGI